MSVLCQQGMPIAVLGVVFAHSFEGNYADPWALLIVALWGAILLFAWRLRRSWEPAWVALLLWGGIWTVGEWRTYDPASPLAGWTAPADVDTVWNSPEGKLVHLLKRLPRVRHLVFPLEAPAPSSLWELWTRNAPLIAPQISSRTEPYPSFIHNSELQRLNARMSCRTQLTDEVHLICLQLGKQTEEIYLFERGPTIYLIQGRLAKQILKRREAKWRKRYSSAY